MKKQDILREKSLAFALRIVNLNKYLVHEHREYVMSKQILRSATSVGANLAESRQAESNSDFIHKLAISNKEASETKFWLTLLKESNYITNSQADSLICDCREIQKLLISSINTLKRKR